MREMIETLILFALMVGIYFAFHIYAVFLFG